MPRSICVDLNIIVDIVQKRTGWDSSATCLDMAKKQGYSLVLPAHLITTFSYLLQRFKVTPHEITAQIEWLLESFTILPIDRALLVASCRMEWKDFEDALVASAAVKAGATYVITRNTKDFTASPVPAITPEEFLARHYV